ncbi:MAG: protein kinase [Myxococcota bacterium]
MDTDAETLPALGSTDAGTGDTRGTSALARGAMLGRYCVLAEVGRGAMGIVYAAYDPKLDRKVAIKLLRERPGGAALSEMIGEAQTLARMNHPNVVQVYDVGEHGESVFMAMEFVVGRSVREWTASEPRSADEIVDVFARAAEGLAAAHDAGVVHRDIKPDNLMVADSGRVLVMDFGLAVRRSTDDSPDSVVATHAAGTPAYMSPEQLRGAPLSASSDQFSFCVALYESLAGERPFAGESLADLSDAILNTKFAHRPPLSTAKPWLRRLILRGLSAEAADRHASVRALGNALRTGRIRRRRVTLAVGGAVVLSVGLAATTRDDRAEAECRAAATKLHAEWTPQRPDLAAAFERELDHDGAALATEVIADVDDYVQRWAGWYDEMCTSAFVHGRLSDAERAARTECLDDGRVYVTSMLESPNQATQDALWKIVAAASALPATLSCDPPAQDRPGDNPPPGKLSATHSLIAHARGRAAVGDNPQVVADLEQALEQLGEIDDPLTRAQLLSLLAKALYETGDLERGRQARADALRESNRAGDRELVAELWLLHVRSLVASHKEPERAAAMLEAAEVAAAAVPDHPLLQSQLHSTRGILALDQARYDDARAHFELALQSSRGAQQTTVKEFHRRSELAFAQSRAGMVSEALAGQRAALALLVDAYGERHPSAIRALDNIAITCRMAGDDACARQSLLRSLELSEPGLPSRANPLLTLGQIAYDAGNDAEAADFAQRSLQLRVAQGGDEHPSTSGARLLLHNIARRSGRVDEALAHARVFKRIKDDATAPDHPGRALGAATLGKALLAAGKHAEAGAALEQALTLRERILPPGDVRIGYSLVDVATAKLAGGELSTAADLAQRAITVLDAANASDAWRGEARDVAARALLTSDRPRALALGQASLRHYEAAGPGSDDDRRALERWLADLSGAPGPAAG